MSGTSVEIADGKSVIQLAIPFLTVSLYKLEAKQKPRTKLSMYPINIHIGEPKTAFT